MNELDMPLGWRQVHTERFERSDGVVVKMMTDTEWQLDLPTDNGMQRLNGLHSALAAMNKADELLPIGKVLSNAIFSGVQQTWDMAMGTAIAVLEDMADQMEAGEWPACCPMCALRAAAGIFRKGEQNRKKLWAGSHGRLFEEAAGNA